MQLDLEIFERLARISLDQINVNAAGIFFAVRTESALAVREALAPLPLKIEERAGCAKLSVVGAGMRGQPGVMHRILAALSEANVEVIHCTDSNITISVLIPENDIERAERAVHDRFELGRIESA